MSADDNDFGLLDDPKQRLGKTEWEDVLIEKGIISAPPPQPDEDEMYTAQVERAQEKKQNAKNKMSLDQVNAAMDDNPDDDEFAALRRKRIAEMKEKALKNKFGKLLPISQQDYSNEVTKASEQVTVVCHLFIWSKPECQLMNQCLEKLADKFKHVKFCKIVAQDAIPNFPDRSAPTILVYRQGNIVLQKEGLSDLGGLKMNAEALEWVLAQAGIVETELTEDPRQELYKTKVNRGPQARRTKDGEDDSDDDMDDA